MAPAVSWGAESALWAVVSDGVSVAVGVFCVCSAAVFALGWSAGLLQAESAKSVPNASRRHVLFLMDIKNSFCKLENVQKIALS